ncbi:MAG TPA: glycerate kinase [Solirubrobacteraceae bacterium]|nr:glycerate kinase [Solirubrobacteraceae bacterium]
MPLPRRPILVAPDAFKGWAAARTVAEAIGRGLGSAGLEFDLAPIADGGEGTAAVLVEQLGGVERRVVVRDPLSREVEASFALLADGRAVVEVAAASGLDLVAEAERDAEAASSAGTGELIVAAFEAGARQVLVAAGGSATSDGGAGAIAVIEAAGGLGGAALTVLCDVRTPFELAAPRFAPQKGADAASVVRLARRLDLMAAGLRRDPRGLPMSGAAGGLAGGLWAAFDAVLVPGAPFVLDALDFDRRLRASHAVILGEGRLDATTLDGKALAEAATRARQLGVPAHAIVAVNAIDRFDARILDLQTIVQARTIDQLTSAAMGLAAQF